MASRFKFYPSADRNERIERAHDTISFCEAIYRIHAQAGNAWATELLVLQAMRRAAVSALQEDCGQSDWM